MISKTTECTGCNACAQKCPNHCIVLEEDRYGFVYPKVDEGNCSSCGLCNQVCHLESDMKQEGASVAYVAVHNSDDTVLASTSGGVFSAIAERILADGGVVYGCAYDENLKPKHIRVNAIKDIILLRGSKYVQSETGNCYREILKDLSEKKKVFFTGTPCQVAGLKTFLGMDYDDLYTADLICHGVPSYAYFCKFIKWIEEKNDCKVVDYNFRSKENAGWSLAGTYTIEKNAKQVKKKAFYYDHYYYHYFLKGDIYRESCYNCRYANSHRVGDFTLGDLWGAEKINSGINIKSGCSLLLVNSSKGVEMMNDLNVSMQEIPLEFAVRNNEQLRVPSRKSVNRDDILEEYCNCSAEEIQKNYRKRYRRKRVIARIKYMILPEIKRLMLRLKP